MKRCILLGLAILLVVALSPAAFATNGDNLIGVGSISRSMGGVGIAAPQDAISAVFANPAAMCFGPYCPGSEFNFDGTLFMPKISTKITLEPFVSPLGPLPGGKVKDDSDDKVYAIPAIGLSVPINNKMRFGLAAYGVSGLGVDYRDTDIESTYSEALGLPPGSITDPAGNEIPVAAGTYTQLQIMKFAPNLGYLINDNLSVGLGIHIDYSALDLGEGASFGYGIGAQLGVLWKATDMLSVGATYITPQNVDHKNVADFDQDGKQDDLELASPQQFGVGVAVQPLGDDKLLIALDGKWINWADAKGYEDFDWEDQYAVAVGAQFKPTKQLALRVGYNYANNPVDEHDDFDGVTATGVNFEEVQGVDIPTYYYETFRIVGFPALITQHVTAGIGYEFSNKFAAHFGYMYAWGDDLKEEGTTLIGQPVTLESELTEQSIEFGLTFRF